VEYYKPLYEIFVFTAKISALNFRNVWGWFKEGTVKNFLFLSVLFSCSQERIYTDVPIPHKSPNKIVTANMSVPPLARCLTIMINCGLRKYGKRPKTKVFAPLGTNTCNSESSVKRIRPAASNRLRPPSAAFAIGLPWSYITRRVNGTPRDVPLPWENGVRGERGGRSDATLAKTLL